MARTTRREARPIPSAEVLAINLWDLEPGRPETLNRIPESYVNFLEQTLVGLPVQLREEFLETFSMERAKALALAWDIRF